MMRSIVGITVLLLILLITPINCFAQETFQINPYYQTIKLSGMTYPRKEMTVTSEVSGRCNTLYADESQAVPQSGKLAEIDTTFLKLELEANKIAMEQAQRKLNQEKKNLDRYTALIKKQSTAQAKFDEIALAVDLYNFTYKKLQNEEARLKEQMARHTILAPSGWLIIERFAEPGEFIQAGQQIAHLGDFRSLLVKLAVTYDELQTLQNMPEIRLFIQDLGKEMKASIYQTSPTFDIRTRKIPMELIINPSPEESVFSLRGGMHVELKFQSRAETNTYIVPSSALISRYDAHWLANPDGSKRQVIVLDEVEETSEAVISGNTLSAGMRFLKEPRASVQ